MKEINKDCYCAIIYVVLFLAIAFLGIAEEKGAVEKYNRCPLSSAIALKYKAEIGEGKIEVIIQQQKTEELIEDLRIYAENFKTWSTTPLPHIVKSDGNRNSSTLTPEASRKQKVEQFKKEWYQGTEPIQQNGSIIVAEMKELAIRRENKAVIYLKSIAESKLPMGLDNPTSAMIKHNYQKPASEAWVTLSMQEGLTDDQKKTWLTNFMANEKGQGQAGKKWAIEAAERMLRKIDKPAGDGISPANKER
jgi:hypothetical protein